MGFKNVPLMDKQNIHKYKDFYHSKSMQTIVPPVLNCSEHICCQAFLGDNKLKFQEYEPFYENFALISAFHHETTIRTVITFKKFFYKSLLKSAYLWSRARL